MPHYSRLNYLFFISIILLSFIHCKKENGKEVVVVEVKEPIFFNSFKLEKKNNAHLSEDISFRIDKDTIWGNGLSRYFPIVTPTFTNNGESIDINGQAQKSESSKVDLSQNIVYTLTSAKGTKKQYVLKINWDDNIAHIDIQTKGNAPIASKQTYVEATIVLNGKKFYTDFTSPAEIKGRGNTTWSYPKKPYKFKLATKTPVAGLAAEKDWVLLANYLDGAHILNAVAMKMGQQIQMPFTNNIIPVEMTLNGQYQGLYMLTEQIEVKNNRVNIGNDGILFQLDSYFDEPWKFKSAVYNLPVQIMDPELTVQDQVTPIQAQFNQMEALVAATNFPNNNYLDYFDADAYANYFIVCLLTGNGELNHPKSTYLYKSAKGKYTLGPLWDFDWAYGYQAGQNHFMTFNGSIFWSTTAVGSRFFIQLLKDTKTKALIKQKWADYRANKFNELLTFVDEYAFLVEGARQKDYLKWRRGNANYKTDITNLKTWLNNRVTYVNTYVNGL